MSFTKTSNSFKNTFLLQVDSDLPTHILLFIPTVVLGCLGGTLGAMFTFINVKMQRLRRKILSQITVEWKKKCVRLAEPCLIMVRIILF